MNDEFVQFLSIVQLFSSPTDQRNIFDLSAWVPPDVSSCLCCGGSGLKSSAIMNLRTDSILLACCILISFGICHDYDR